MCSTGSLTYVVDIQQPLAAMAAQPAPEYLVATVLAALSAVRVGVTLTDWVLQSGAAVTFLGTGEGQCAPVAVLPAVFGAAYCGLVRASGPHR